MDGWPGDGGGWDAAAIEREHADVARREGRERLHATPEQLAAYEMWKKARRVAAQEKTKGATDE